MRLLILFILIFSLSASANPAVDNLFRSFQGQVPGAAVGIYREGQILYEKGYGLRDLETAAPVTPTTSFRLASLTKQFTALSILILIQRGLLTLETKLTDVFPSFPPYGRSISIRHLLNHTGGLKDYENLIPGGQTQQLSDYDVLKILERQSSGVFSPGTQYRYSNSGYVVLGLVVEKISQMLFSDFLRSQVFNPLGMEHSLMYERYLDSQITERAFGYTGQGTQFSKTDQSLTSATRGDGGVYTSVHEWLQWDESLNNASLVSASLLQQMFTPGKLNNGNPIQYGFGWMLDTSGGEPIQTHTGSSIGFRTAVRRYPARKLTVLVLMNRAGVSPWDTALEVARLYP